MDAIFGPIVIIVVLIWAFRLEIGIDKANESLKRIEEHLGIEKIDEKKEKKVNG